MTRVVERFSQNPNCVGRKTLYLFQKFKSLRLIIVSNILLKTKRIIAGRQFFNLVLKPPLCKGVTRDIFSLSE